jgi:hypothetical protein
MESDGSRLIAISDVGSWLMLSKKGLRGPPNADSVV